MPFGDETMDILVILCDNKELMRKVSLIIIFIRGCFERDTDRGGCFRLLSPSHMPHSIPYTSACVSVSLESASDENDNHRHFSHPFSVIVQDDNILHCFKGMGNTVVIPPISEKALSDARKLLGIAMGLAMC
jgi:hypothetical protein